jgi:hypothetical protein
MSLLLLATLAATVPAAVQRAADLQRGDAHGVVAYLAEAEGTIKTPLSTTRTRTRTWVVAIDGDPRRAVTLALTIDGRPGTEAERAKAQADAEAGYADPKRQLFAPYDRRRLAGYRFAPAPAEPGLAPGELAFAFDSPIPDGRHGHGSFVLTADDRVRRLAFTPNRYPPRARAGGLLLTRGPVAKGWWSLLTLSAAYTGGIGPLTGGLDLLQRSSRHQRFASVEAALAAAPRP